MLRRIHDSVDKTINQYNRDVKTSLDILRELDVTNRKGKLLFEIKLIIYINKCSTLHHTFLDVVTDIPGGHDHFPLAKYRFVYDLPEFYLRLG